MLDGANIGYFGRSREEAAYRKSKAERKGRALNPGPSVQNMRSPSHLPDILDSIPAPTSSFDLKQIEVVLSHIQRVTPSARVLVVLHVSHTLDANLDDEATALVCKWRSEGILCNSPAGLNDDWLWLYAAVASGPNCRVVSNDEMRDHHYGLMQSPAFLKWKERHVVHFKMSSSDQQGVVPVLTSPLPYSHVMQKHPSGYWHIPCSEPTQQWVCIHRSA